MGIEYIVLLLLGFMLVAALIAVEASDLLSSVIAIGAAGFALSIIFLLLGAPDLAITQLVVETIALVLLIRLVLTRRDTTTETPRDALRTGLVLLAGGLLLSGAYVAFSGVSGSAGVPPFGEPVLTHQADADVPPGVSAHYLARSAEQTGAANAVMAVLLDYRAYDTLGEATILFVATLGTYAVLRRFGRKKENELEAEP